MPRRNTKPLADLERALRALRGRTIKDLSERAAPLLEEYYRQRGNAPEPPRPPELSLEDEEFVALSLSPLYHLQYRLRSLQKHHQLAEKGGKGKDGYRAPWPELIRRAVRRSEGEEDEKNYVRVSFPHFRKLFYEKDRVTLHNLAEDIEGPVGIDAASLSYDPNSHTFTYTTFQRDRHGDEVPHSRRTKTVTAKTVAAHIRKFRRT